VKHGSCFRLMLTKYRRSDLNHICSEIMQSAIANLIGPTSQYLDLLDPRSSANQLHFWQQKGSRRKTKKHRMLYLATFFFQSHYLLQNRRLPIKLKQRLVTSVELGKLRNISWPRCWVPSAQLFPADTIPLALTMAFTRSRHMVPGRHDPYRLEPLQHPKPLFILHVYLTIRASIVKCAQLLHLEVQELSQRPYSSSNAVHCLSPYGNHNSDA